MTAVLNRRPLVAAGVCLGIGMGGFVDGILFHQILQLHNMLSNWVVRDSLVNEQINMFWDGLFHAFTWAMTALGLFLLWRTVQRDDVPLSDKTFAGSLLLGWGIFNLVEGVLDHEILQVHHVVEDGSHLTWDAAFLLSGLVFFVLGLLLIRAGGADGRSRAA